MTLSITLLDSAADATGGSTKATASVAPSALRWLVLDVATRVATGTANTPTMSGAFTFTTELVVTTGLAKITRFYVWTDASPGSGVITIDFAAQTQQCITYVLAEMDGLGWSSPFVQSVGATSASANNITATLAAYSLGINRPYMTAFIRADAAATVDATPSAYTLLANPHNTGTTPCSIAAEYNATDADVTPSMSWTPTDVIRAVASELRLKGPTTKPHRYSTRQAVQRASRW
jgi:hypothetical protein